MLFVVTAIQSISVETSHIFLSERAPSRAPHHANTTGASQVSQDGPMSGYLRDKNSARMSLRLRISPGMAQDACLYLVLLRRRSLLRWRRMEIGPKERREGSLSASTSTSTPDTSEKPRIVIEFPPAFPYSKRTGAIGCQPAGCVSLIGISREAIPVPVFGDVRCGGIRRRDDGK